MLDVGCGSGRFCALALERGARVSGIDGAAAMIALAGRNAPGADLCVGPLEALPWADASFDAVTSINSLQFADDPVVALREWARVTRPGGAIAICVWGPHEECELEALETPLRTEPWGPRFCERMLDVIEDAGLELRAHGPVSVPFEVPDFEALMAAMLFDARGYGVPEAEAREPDRARRGALQAPRRRLPPREPVPLRDQRPAIGVPDSSTVLRSDSTHAQPPPAPLSSSWPATIAASVGAPSSSWMIVSLVTPPSIDSISCVSLVNPSPFIVSSISIRQVWTSLRGGSTSRNSPSMITSGTPGYAFIAAPGSALARPPTRRS